MLKQLKHLCPLKIRNLIRHSKKRRVLKQYGFDVDLSNGLLTLFKDGVEVHVKEGIRSLNNSTYVLAILNNWQGLRQRGFEVLLSRNSITLGRGEIKVYIDEVDKQPYLTDYLTALINHWESISTDDECEVVSIAGVVISGTTASTVYNGANLEFEISKHWMRHNLEEVFFFSDILPNYLNGVQLMPGQVVFDVGGYHGLFAMAAAVSVGPKGRVYCFEPDSDNRKVISRNLERNGMTNVKIVPMMMSGKSGERKFIRSSSLGSHIADNRDKETRECSPTIDTIESTTLQDFCTARSIRPPIFLKADIEGAEIELIECNPKWIAQNSITFAIASYHLIDGNPAWIRLERKFRDLGYSVRTIHTGHTTTIAKKG